VRASRRMAATLIVVCLVLIGEIGALRVPIAPRRASVQLLAKKKGGGKAKGGKAKKESGFAWAANFELKPTESNELRELAEIAVSTYRTRTGKSLHRSLDRGGDVPKALWKAPVCVMIVREKADGTEIAYANPAAAEAHELPTSDGYKALMAASAVLPVTLADKKYESGYQKTLQQLGKTEDGVGAATFIVRDAERWTLEKMGVVNGKLASEPLGLVYAFSQWELADGTTCEPGGKRTAPSIDPAELIAAVDKQAARVRELKDSGLTNADAEVKDAVAELLRLKAIVPPEE
jgi:hypothetical protein